MIQYFTHTWMTKINSWNIIQLEHITNNNIEGFPKHINAKLPRSRNLWTILLCVQNYHKNSVIDLASVLAGHECN